MTKMHTKVPSLVDRSLPVPVMNCQRSMAMVAILKAVTITIVVCRPGPSLQRTRPRCQLISIYLRRVRGAQIRHNKMSLKLWLIHIINKKNKSYKKSLINGTIFRVQC